MFRFWSVCGFARIPSLADICVGLPPSVLASLRVVLLGGGSVFLLLCERALFLAEASDSSDLGFSLATWSPSGMSQGFAWVSVSFGSKDFP